MSQSLLHFHFHALCLLLLLPLLSEAQEDNLATPARNVLREAGFGIDLAEGIFSALAILTGFLFCFYGKRLFKFSLFLAGLYFFGVTTYLALTNAQDKIDLGENRSTLILIISGVAGVCGALLAVCIYRFGIYLIGAVGGFFFSLWLLSIMGSHGQALEGTWRVVFIIGIVIVGIIAMFKAEKHFIVIATSMAGSFAMVLGADSYIDTGYLHLVDSLVGGAPFDPDSITPSIYGMIVTTALLSIVGMVVQYKRSGSKSEK